MPRPGAPDRLHKRLAVTPWAMTLSSTVQPPTIVIVWLPGRSSSRTRPGRQSRCRSEERRPRSQHSGTFRLHLHDRPKDRLSRAGYHPGDPRWTAAARSDAREAPRALAPAACLARSADRAGLWLSAVRAQRSTAQSSSANAPALLGSAWHSRRPHQRRCGTGIWRDRDIAAGWRDLVTPCASLPTRSPSHRAQPRGKPGFSTLESSSGRETDSPLEGAVRSEPVSEVGLLRVILDGNNRFWR